MWIFFYPFTAQQDKALERQPLDRVTQFSQMEIPMPKNWNCLVQRAEEKAPCWAKERKQHSKVRLERQAAHDCGPLHLAPRGKTLPSLPEQAGWSQSRSFSHQPNYFILLDSCPFLMRVYCDLYFFPNSKWIWSDHGGQGYVFHRESCLLGERE